MKSALLILTLAVITSGQTLTLQGGVGASNNLGTKPGPILEARAESPWFYTRGSFAFERKAYLNSGTIATGDLLARYTHRQMWTGAGVELSHASTVAYTKTAYRLLIGGGYVDPKWSLSVFGFPPEYGTRNRSVGVRGEISVLPWRGERQALVITIRPYVLRYHNGPEWGTVYSGSGVEVLAGMRFGH